MSGGGETTVDPNSTCDWCGKPGHDEADHPLPKDHPDYDAFNDADDDELRDVINDALDRQGWR